MRDDANGCADKQKGCDDNGSPDAGCPGPDVDGLRFAAISHVRVVDGLSHPTCDRTSQFVFGDQVDAEGVNVVFEIREHGRGVEGVGIEDGRLLERRSVFDEVAQLIDSRIQSAPVWKFVKGVVMITRNGVPAGGDSGLAKGVRDAQESRGERNVTISHCGRRLSRIEECDHCREVCGSGSTLHNVDTEVPQAFKTAREWRETRMIELHDTGQRSRHKMTRPR